MIKLLNLNIELFNCVLKIKNFFVKSVELKFEN